MFNVKKNKKCLVINDAMFKLIVEVVTSRGEFYVKYQ